MDAEQSSKSKNSWKRAAAASPESCCHSSPSSSTATDSSPLFTSDSSNSISSRNPNPDIRHSPDSTSATPFSSSNSPSRSASAAKQSEPLHQRFRALLRASAATGRAQYCLSHRRGHVHVQHTNPARVPVSVEEDRHVRHSDASNDSVLSWQSNPKSPAGGSLLLCDVLEETKRNALLHAANHHPFCKTTTDAHQIDDDCDHSKQGRSWARGSTDGIPEANDADGGLPTFRLSDTDWEKKGHADLLRSPSAAAWNRGGDDDDEGKAFSSPPRSSHSAPFSDPSSSSPWKQGYYMRLAEQDGCPCYIFAVDSAQEEEALVCRMSRPQKKSDNWVYTFHSKTAAAAAKPGRWRKEMSGSNVLLGKMRVYENVGRPSRSHILHQEANYWSSETHFVLYGKKKQPRSLRKGAFESVLPRMAMPPSSMLPLAHCREKHHFRRSLDHFIGNPPAAAAVAPDSWSNNTSKQHKNQNSKDFVRTAPRMRRVELAAIVVRTSVVEEEDCSEAGDGDDAPRKAGVGWGVKFLATHSGRGWGMRFLDRASQNHDGRIRRNRRDEILDKCACEICRGDRIRIPRDCICKIGRRDENLQEFTCDICHRDEIVDDWKCKICHRSQSPCERGHLRRSREEDGSAGGRPRSRNQKRSAEVAVILPAGDHGLPREDGDMEGEREAIRGPTPLVERWRSGGSCECGGWDMGCGITVLKSNAINLPITEHRRKAPVENQAMVEWPAPGTPLHISMQGNKPSTLLTLESIGAGHFFVSFQGPFSSPLQAFATAVAILHQQIS